MLDVIQETIVIKKYQNRKLYNTETSKYVTLVEIQEMIEKGLDVQVLSNESGKDITGEILLKIWENKIIAETNLSDKEFQNKMIAIIKGE